MSKKHFQERNSDTSIKEVYSYNFIKEMEIIRVLVEKYPYIAMV